MSVSPLPTRDFLTRRELAERYRVSERTVDRWVEQGLPVERWSSRLVRFRVVQTDGWLERRSAA